MTEEVMELYRKAAKKIEDWTTFGQDHHVACNFQPTRLNQRTTCNCGVTDILYALSEDNKIFEAEEARLAEEKACNAFMDSLPRMEMSADREKYGSGFTGATYCENKVCSHNEVIDRFGCRKFSYPTEDKCDDYFGGPPMGELPSGDVTVKVEREVDTREIMEPACEGKIPKDVIAAAVAKVSAQRNTNRVTIEAVLVNGETACDGCIGDGIGNCSALSSTMEMLGLPNCVDESADDDDDESSFIYRIVED